METEQIEKKKKHKLAFPETSLLLMIIIVVAAIMTYIVPAGEFDRVTDEETGREIVQAGTYKEIESNPTTIPDLLAAVYSGIVKAVEIIAFVFVVGGAFGIVSRSGSISAGLGTLVRKLKGRESLMVFIIMAAFAVCGATFGMAEEALPFVLILVTVALKMGYDPIVGVAMVVVGLYCGYSAGPLNPFNTGIAQGIAELPLFSGMWLRIILMVGALIIAWFFVVRHGEKYKKEGHDNTELLKKYNAKEEAPMTAKDRVILLVLVATIAVLIFGVMKFGWYFKEISALFMAMGIVVGLISRKGNLNQIARDFVDGAGDMTVAAIFIGLSRAILVIMENGGIMDTIVYAMSIPLSHFNKMFAAWGIIKYNFKLNT